MSKFLTKEEAAKLLGVTKRTIYQHIRQGRLNRVCEGNKVGVLEEEVLTLKGALEEPTLIPFNRSTFLKMHAEHMLMRQQLNTVMRILNVRHNPLALTDAEWSAMHEMARFYSEDTWPPHAEGMWADTFIRMRQDDLEVVKRATGDDNPWINFYRLAGAMSMRPFDKELKDQFLAGKNNVQILAGVWCQLNGTSPKGLDVMLKDSAPSKRLLNKLDRVQRQ